MLGRFYRPAGPFNFRHLTKFQYRNIDMDCRDIGIDRIELRQNLLEPIDPFAQGLFISAHRFRKFFLSYVERRNQTRSR